MARGPKITREDQSILKTHESNSILDEYISIMEKNAVKAYNPYAEIQSLFNPKSKYRTVDEAVKDMQDRSGLAKYLTSVKTSIDKQNTKIAYVAPDTDNKYVSPMEAMKSKTELPELIKEHPELEQFIEERAKTSKGTMAIPAIQHAISKVLGTSDKVYEENLVGYIHGKLSEYKVEKDKINTQYGGQGGLSEAKGDLFSAISPTIENK